MSRIEGSRARRVDAAEIRTRADLADVDYLDCFMIEMPPALATRSAEDWSPEDWSPEDWARRTFEGAPVAMRLFLLFGWRFGLGLRLGPRPSPSHVLGWAILSSTPDAVVLGVESAILGSARLVVFVDHSRVAVGSAIRFKRPAARAIWSVVGLIHRQALPYLLSRAAS